MLVCRHSLIWQNLAIMYTLWKKIRSLEGSWPNEFIIEIKTNYPIGKDKTIDDLIIKEDYKAVYIATGAHRGLKLNITE